MLLPLPHTDMAVSAALTVGFAALILAIVGVADDVRTLPRSLRLLTQIGASVAAWSAGFRVDTSLGPSFDFALSLLWIVGITNAFNLLDNMDGLSSGIAGIAAITFAVMGLLGDMPEVTIAAAAAAGAAFGFLAHNRHPAKVFMGDAGSLFLGFSLALIGIKLRFDNLIQVTFLVPVVVLGLPIFDTTLVLLSRWKHGKPLFSGGRDHVSHRLEKLGLPVRATVGFLYFSAICTGWLGIAISRANVQVGWILLGFVITVGIFFGVLLWTIPVYNDDAARPETAASDGT